MRFLCRIGWHEWGMWAEVLIKEYTFLDMLTGSSRTYKNIQAQETYCVYCNKHKVKVG